MKNKLSKLFTDETEVIDVNEVNDLEAIDETFQVEPAGKVNPSSRGKLILFSPVSTNSVHEIIEAVKRGEVALVNLGKLNSDEQKIVYSNLNGATSALDGVIEPLSDALVVCVPNNFSLEGEI
jgi:FtsZ-interacting cell division protein YlmF